MFENWKTYKLSELTTKIGSGATPSGGKEAYKENGVSLIRSQNVLDFSFSINGLAFIDDKQAKALNNVAVESRDILLNITGDSVARVCQVPDEWLPARVNQHVAILRADQEVLNPEYLLYYLLTKKNKDHLLTLASAGATRNALTKVMIEGFEITLPALREQKAIASVLSSLDDKIELNLQMNKTLEEMAMVLYKHWFVDFGPFQNGKFIESELGMIPEGWEVKRLEEFADVIDSLHKTPKYIESGFPMVRVTDINAGFLNLEKTLKVSEEVYEEFSKKYKPKQGDVLMSRVGTYGVSSYVASKNKFCLGQNTIVIVPKNVESSFLFYALNSPSLTNQIEEQVTGSTQKTISLKSIRNLKVVLPIDLNNNELSEFNSQISKWLMLGSEFSYQNQTLTTLRDTLLPKLISGEVRVKDVEQMVAASL